MGCGCNDKRSEDQPKTYEFPKPRRSIISRVKAGIYVPTRQPLADRWTRPKWGNFGRGINRRMRGRLFSWPIIWAGNPCVPLAESINPDGDDSDGGDGMWTFNGGPTTFWQCTDDLGDDTDGVSTPGEGLVECATQDDTWFIVTLENPSADPGSSDCQGMRYVNRWADDQDTEGGCINHIGQLRETTTTRRTANEQADMGGFNTINDTLNTAQFDAIGNHNNLRSYNEKEIGKPDPKAPPPTGVTLYTGAEYYAL